MHPTFTWPSSPIVTRPESGIYGAAEAGTGCVQSWANAEIKAELLAIIRSNQNHDAKKMARATLAMLPVLDQVVDAPVGDDSAAAKAVNLGTRAQRFMQGGAGGLPALNASNEPAHVSISPGHEFAVSWPENVRIADDTLLDAYRAYVQHNFNVGYGVAKTGTNVDAGL